MLIHDVLYAGARVHRFLTPSLRVDRYACDPDAGKTRPAFPEPSTPPTVPVPVPLRQSVESTVTRRETTPRTPHNYTTTLQKPYNVYMYVWFVQDARILMPTINRCRRTTPSVSVSKRF